MRPACRLTSFAIALTLLVGPSQARADMVVLNNLNQTAQTTSKSAFIGQSFIAGTAEPLYGAQMQLSPNAPPSSQITLEVESRTAAGTVGQTIFSNFSSSYNSTTGLITFLADGPFTFQANTGYWLVLSDPTKGGVTWDFTASQIYQSNLGYGLPSYDTSYYSTRDNGLGSVNYYQPSDGPQMFDLITVPGAVPEPPSLVLMGVGMMIAVWAIHHRNSRLATLTRSRVGEGPKTVPSPVA
jgi:hypothetical protein